MTNLDRARLRTLLDRAAEFSSIARLYADELKGEIDAADDVDPTSVPEDVVTMNSTVCLRDLESGETATYTIVYPRYVDVARNRISILGPLAPEILGKRVGDVLEWTAAGQTHRVLIEALEFQPERTGNFDI